MASAGFQLPQFPAMGFWQGFAQLARSMEPVARANTQVGLELLALAGTRARIAAEVPAGLAGCRSPMDVAQLQMRLWQETTRESVATAQRVFGIWQGAMLPGLVNDDAKAAPAPRDYLALEPKPEAATDRRPMADATETRRAA